MAYMMSRGPIPDGLLVCHTCDNPPCCNPDHLWVGTNGDNTQDSLKKGRMATQKGEANHSAKLTNSDVIGIRSTGRDVPAWRVALRYGVVDSTIRRIRRGANWKHLR